MKLSIATFLLAVGMASAGINPELSIAVSTKDASELSGRFEPAMKWSTERAVGECNVEVRMTTTMTRSRWEYTRVYDF